MNDSMVRHLTLLDVPRVHRLMPHGVILDSRLACTRAGWAPASDSLRTLLMPRSGLNTLVTRGPQTLVGQFRLRADDYNAQVVYIAPALVEGMPTDASLLILDAMAQESGRQRAHALIAEVDESAPLFGVMRTCGFSVYARQQIWVRQPDDPLPPYTPLDLAAVQQADIADIQWLHAGAVPGLLKQLGPVTVTGGYVYRKAGRLMAYVDVTYGRGGVYLSPTVHPDLPMTETADLLASVLAQCPPGLPVCLCVRRYHNWLISVVDELGFYFYKQQALMVRHIAARVRHAKFTALRKQLNEVVAAQRVGAFDAAQDWPGDVSISANSACSAGGKARKAAPHRSRCR